MIVYDIYLFYLDGYVWNFAQQLYRYCLLHISNTFPLQVLSLHCHYSILKFDTSECIDTSAKIFC